MDAEFQLLLIIFMFCWYGIASKDDLNGSAELLFRLAQLNIFVFIFSLLSVEQGMELPQVTMAVTIDAGTIGVLTATRMKYWRLLSFTLILHIINHGFSNAPHYDIINLIINIIEMSLFIGAVKNVVSAFFGRVFKRGDVTNRTRVGIT